MLGMSTVACRPRRVSDLDSAPFCGSGRIVAYPEIDYLFGNTADRLLLKG